MFYRFLLRNFLARNVLVFANDIVCYADGDLIFAFICAREDRVENSQEPLLEIALEFSLNIHCQNSASLFSIILNIGEFLLSLKTQNITIEV